MFAEPRAIAVSGGSVCALLAGTGQIVRLDPNTLAPTVIAGGLVSPSGLAYLAGWLYVTSLVNDQRVIGRVNPATGATTTLPAADYIPDAVGLQAFPQLPGLLFGSGYGTIRRDLVTGTAFHLPDSGGNVQRLPDGDLVTNYTSSIQPSGVLATGRRQDSSSACLRGRCAALLTSTSRLMGLCTRLSKSMAW